MKFTKEQFEEAKRKYLRQLIDEHINQMAEIDNHTYEDCKGDKHILFGFATGGRDGHYVEHCKLCDYKSEGWD